MAIIETLINVSIAEAPAAVSAELTSIPLLIADVDPGWDGDDVVRAYGSVAEMQNDLNAPDSALPTYATRLMGGDTKPATFLVGKKSSGGLTSLDIRNIFAADNSAYAVIPVKATDDEIMTLADTIEGLEKLAFCASSTPTNGNKEDKTSVASKLQAGGYRRTALMFSPGSADKGIEAAWVGGYIPATPGTAKPAYNTLRGIAADALSTGQILSTVGNLSLASPGNRANVYISLQNRGATLAGTTGGSNIYTVQGLDWLRFNMRAECLSVLLSGKTDLTDRGVQTFVAAVRGVLMAGVKNGLLDPAPGKDEDGNDLPGITVTAAPVSTLTAAQKAGGVCPTINFTCTMAGPINAIAIHGQLKG